MSHCEPKIGAMKRCVLLRKGFRCTMRNGRQMPKIERQAAIR